jgi:hypothetical protein
VQAVLFVPVIYTMIGFTMAAEKFLYYAFMFLASISFYTIFGQFMVYVTPSQQIAQVRNITGRGLRQGQPVLPTSSAAQDALRK